MTVLLPRVAARLAAPLFVVVAMAVGVLVSAATAYATDYTWTGITQYGDLLPTPPYEGPRDREWNNPNNWSPNGVPGPGDTVTVNGDVKFPGDASQSVSPILTGEVTVANVNLTAGTISGGKLTVTGVFNWQSDALDAGVPFEVQTGVLLPAGARMNISGSNTKGLLSIIENYGTITWMGGNLENQTSGAHVPRPGGFYNHGRVEIATDADFAGNGLWPIFRNFSDGIVVKLNSAGTTVLGTTGLDNDGTVSVQSGTLRIGALGGGDNETSSGVFEAEARGTIEWDGPTLTGARLTGPGLHRSYQLSPNGNNGFLGSATLGTTTAPARYELGNNGQVVGNLTVVNGTFTWTGGNIHGNLTINSGSRLEIIGTATKGLSSTINNSGTVVFKSGGITSTSGVVNNLVGGLFEARSLANFAPALRNGGTLEIFGATTAFGAFNADDFTQLSTGTLNIDIGGFTAATQYDQLVVNGTAALGGTLNVRLPNATFTPSSGDRFTVIAYPSHTGTFATINGPFQPDYEDPNLILGLVTEAPRITSYTPGSGEVGAQITINGANLRNASVFFGNARAVVNTAQSSATRLVVTVPTGATSGPLRIVNQFGSAVSATPFTVVLTISGTITSGTAPIPGVSGPVPNVPVLLVNRTNLPALAAAVVNPSLLAGNTSIIQRKSTNAAGAYSFVVQPGSYYVAPVLQGVVFATPYKQVSITNSSVGNQNFVGAGVDNSAPPAPTISTTTGSEVSGSASDPESGIFTVVVTLQNSTGQYLNWTTVAAKPLFTAAAVVGSYRIANAPRSIVPILNTSKVSPQSWAVTLPNTLPIGSYTLTVRAVNRALRISVPVTRVITKGGTVPLIGKSAALSTATANAATSSVTLKFKTALNSESASNPAHYQVEVNGNIVLIESAGYNAAFNTATLSLVEGALQTGDRVVVRWSGVMDSQHRDCSGQIGPLSVK